MSAPDGQVERGEAAGQLRYLAIKLLGYVSELPSRSLPPRGRVPWSPGDLVELRRLAHAASVGEADAELAVAALDAIDGVFHRSIADAPMAAGPDEAARLADYLVRRDIAMDRLPRLQRKVAERAATPSAVRSPWWSGVWATVSRIARRRGAS